MKFCEENTDSNGVIAPYNLCPKGVYILNMCTTIANTFLLSSISIFNNLLIASG